MNDYVSLPCPIPPICITENAHGIFNEINSSIPDHPT